MKLELGANDHDSSGLQDISSLNICNSSLTNLVSNMDAQGVITSQKDKAEGTKQVHNPQPNVEFVIGPSIDSPNQEVPNVANIVINSPSANNNTFKEMMEDESKKIDSITGPPQNNKRKIGSKNSSKKGKGGKRKQRRKIGQYKKNKKCDKKRGEESDEELEVEEVLGKEIIKGKVYYIIKWLGLDMSHSTLLTIDKLQGCLDLVKDYEENAPKARHRKTKPEPIPCTSNERREEEVETEVTGAEEDKYSALEEAIDRQFMGPMFRRFWKKSEVPLCIVGSTFKHGDLLHLVKIKVDGDEHDPEDPLEGLNEHNCVMVLNDDFKVRFPDLMLKYYTENFAFVKDHSTDVENGEKAARASVAKLVRTKGIAADEKKLFHDMMKATETNSSAVLNDSQETKKDAAPGYFNGKGTCFAQFGSSVKSKSPTKSPPKFDKVGLPYNYDSESSDSSSGDDCLEERVVKRKIPATRRIFNAEDDRQEKATLGNPSLNAKAKRKESKEKANKKPKLVIDNKNENASSSLNSEATTMETSKDQEMLVSKTRMDELLSMIDDNNSPQSRDFKNFVYAVNDEELDWGTSDLDD